MRSFLAGIIIVLAIEAAAFFAFIYSGSFNVAADSPDPPGVDWILETVRENSIDNRIKNVQVPPDFDKINTSKAAEDFKNVCVNCHVAPGIQHSMFGMGLNPAPPDLGDSAAELSPATIFWFAKNGIKMTGMPSFSKMFSEPELWAITAYIKTFPKMGRK
jgi:mono/diheme cytochrome c family protein